MSENLFKTIGSFLIQNADELEYKFLKDEKLGLPSGMDNIFSFIKEQYFRGSFGKTSIDEVRRIVRGVIAEETEGKGEMSKDKESKIIDFIKNNKNLDDSKFHNFVEKMGADPHEAEEVVYRKLNSLLNKKD